jgi:hypothetical protein
MVEYKLLNPYVEGTIDNSFSGKSPLDAAKKAWSALSENFSNFTPQFAFTISSGGSTNESSMHHFTVKEHIKNGKVNFTVAKLKSNPASAKLKKFTSKFNAFQQNIMKGGKEHEEDDSEKHKKKKKKSKDEDDSSSSDSNSDSDDKFYDKIRAHKHKSQIDTPIWWFWYYPTLYPIDTVFIPTWTTYVSPYVQIIF